MNALERHSLFTPPEGSVVLVVMDGVGIGGDNEGNAVRIARTPVLDRIFSEYPLTQLAAHGPAVGMPSWKDMGNSEVGHNAIGAGRVFAQGARLVKEAIESRRIFESATWNEMIGQNLERGSALHLIGLLSDGNVHSHIDHLFALIREADRRDVKRLFVHPLLDGRDVEAKSALDYVRPLEQLLQEIRRSGERNYRIASGGGRMLVTMDRYFADWTIVERGYNAHVHGKGRAFVSAEEAITAFRSEDPAVIDQFLPPFVVVEDGRPVGPMSDGDTVVYFNFRGDRAIEISMAFENDDFAGFDRGRRPDVCYAGMMQYDGDLKLPARFLVQPPAITRTMGEYLARSGVRQLAISETQKFGHVTYFWNGNRSGKFDEELETYIEIPSDKVPFETAPEMKAALITDAVIEKMKTRRFPFIRLNYANGDMVGHTGVLEAAVKAMEVVDENLGRLLEAVKEMNGVALITADHGNSDEMFEVDRKTGELKRNGKGERIIRTSHTLNPVPFAIVGPPPFDRVEFDESLERPMLSHIASTVLLILGYEPPEDYDPPLIKHPIR